MDYDMTTNHIKSLIDNNCLDEAIHLLSHRIETNKEDDEAYYLMGNVYRKQGNTGGMERRRKPAQHING